MKLDNVIAQNSLRASKLCLVYKYSKKKKNVSDDNGKRVKCTFASSGLCLTRLCGVKCPWSIQYSFSVT
jgi:hypothetical protein